MTDVVRSEVRHTLRQRCLLAGLLSLLAAIILVVLVVGNARSNTAGPTHTVAQVQTGLTQRPSAWIGRVVRVRGVLTKMLFCVGAMPSHSRCWYTLLSTNQLGRRQGIPSLPISADHVGKHLLLWQRLPFISRFFPDARVLTFNQYATYRVRLERTGLPRPQCLVITCYQAVLQDGT